MIGDTFYTVFPKVGTDEGNDEDLVPQILIQSSEQASVQLKSSIQSTDVTLNGFYCSELFRRI